MKFVLSFICCALFGVSAFADHYNPAYELESASQGYAEEQKARLGAADRKVRASDNWLARTLHRPAAPIFVSGEVKPLRQGESGAQTGSAPDPGTGPSEEPSN